MLFCSVFMKYFNIFSVMYRQSKIRLKFLQITMTDILERSFNNDNSKQEVIVQKNQLTKAMNQTTITQSIESFDLLKLEGFFEVSSAAWITPSPSPILCSPGKVKVVSNSKNLRKSMAHDDCKSLYRNVPPVRPHFKVIRKIGSGTFSNVYLATLRSLGENSPQFALKHIFSTSHPKRIANEIRCLNEIGGCQHVIGIESCIRYKGEVVIVMPYQRHSDFMELLNKMTIDDIQQYMRHLLTALCRVHQKNVIHRDVKPNNFLFHLESQESGLVDFGLAQFLNPDGIKQPGVLNEKTSREDNSEPPKVVSKVSRRKANSVSVDENIAFVPKAKRRCLAELQLNVMKTSPKKALNTKEKKALLLTAENKKMPRFSQSCNAENISLPKPNSASLHDKFQFMSLTSPTSLVNRPARRSSTVTIADVFPSVRKYGRVKSPSAKKDTAKSKIDDKSCSCFGKLSVCYKCLARPAANASRAGTAGFRPPEVLLRYPAQTTAVDIWSAGVIFLSLLCGRCPFFRPAEDVDSLAQLVFVFGSRKMQDVARSLGRKLSCSEHFYGRDLRGIVTALRQPSDDEGPTLRNSPKRRGLVKGESPRKLSQSNQGFEIVDIPDSAFDLLRRMLDPNPRSRITALKALYHDFLITEERKTFVSPKTKSTA